MINRNRIRKAASLTSEDHDVVAQIVLRRGISWLAILMTSSYESDAADSLVMLHRENFRQQCLDVRAPAMRPALYWRFYPWR